MEYIVEYTETFESWWSGLSEAEQKDIAAVIELLEKLGPHLPFPYSSRINGSKHREMRELRIQHRGKPYQHSMRSIRGEQRSCSLEGIKLAINDGIRNILLLLMSSLISI